MTIVGRLLCMMVCLAGLTAIAQAQPARPARPAQPAPQSSSQAAVGEREVLVQNRSKRTINEVYVSATAADQWGEDRLNDGVMAPGGSLRVKLGRLRDCSFDVQVIYDDGSRESVEGHNACRTRQLAFDGSKAVAAPVPAEPEHTFTLHNYNTRAIQQVFVSPADSQQWGDDVLTDSEISVGDNAEITYRGACVADLRVVFDNRAAEERRGIDLCETTSLSIVPGWTTADTVQVPPAATPDAAPDAPAPAVTKPVETRPVTVTNRSGAAIVEFYLYADDADGQGTDLLRAKVIADGGQEVVAVPKDQPCRVSARAVLAGDRADKRLAGLDVCADPAVTVQP